MAFEDPFIFLQELGLLDVILPFFFVFTIVFAILQKVKIFGTSGRPKTYNVMVSFITSLFFIFSAERVAILNSFLIKVVSLMIAAIMVFIIMGVVVKEPLFKSRLWIGVIFAVLVIIFASTLDWFKWSDLSVLLQFLISPVLLALLVLIAIIWYITRTSGEERERAKQEKKQRRQEQETAQKTKKGEEKKTKKGKSTEPSTPGQAPQEKKIGGRKRGEKGEWEEEK